MNNMVVLDASALLALIQKEPGGEVVQPMIHRAVISTVNLTEVLTVLQKFSLKTEETLESITTMIKSVSAFTIEQSKQAADLHELTKRKGLSLGDRACLALGMTLKAPVYTADKIWKELNLEDIEIQLIR